MEFRLPNKREFVSKNDRQADEKARSQFLADHDASYVPMTDTQIERVLDGMSWSSYQEVTTMSEKLMSVDAYLSQELAVILHPQTLANLGVSADEVKILAHDLAHEIVEMMARLITVYKLPPNQQLGTQIVTMPDGAMARFDVRGTVLFSWGMMYLMMKYGAELQFGPKASIQQQKNLLGKRARAQLHLKKSLAHELIHGFQLVYMPQVLKEAMAAGLHALQGNLGRYRNSDAEKMAVWGSQRALLQEQERLAREIGLPANELTSGTLAALLAKALEENQMKSASLIAQFAVLKLEGIA